MLKTLLSDLIDTNMLQLASDLVRNSTELEKAMVEKLIKSNNFDKAEQYLDKINLI